MIYIFGFPLPPSVNSSLVPIIRNGKPYLVHSKERKQYQKDCHTWALLNARAVEGIKQDLQKLRDQYKVEGKTFALKVDCFFVFHVEQIITQKNRLSLGVDLDNRIKPIWDSLKSLLGVDDRHYYAGNFEKLTTTEKGKECAVIKISAARPRTYEEIRAQLMTEARNSQTSLSNPSTEASSS